MNVFKEADAYAKTLPEYAIFDETKQRLKRTSLTEDTLLGIQRETSSRVRSIVVNYTASLNNYTNSKQKLNAYTEQFDSGQIGAGEYYQRFIFVKNAEKSGKQKALDFMQQLMNRGGSRDVIQEISHQVKRFDNGLISEEILEQMVLKAKREYILNMDNT